MPSIGYSGTTIGRNATRKLAAITSSPLKCRVFSLGNGFSGAECPAAAAWSDFDRFDFARLRTDGKGNYIVHVHSNLWYELSAL